MKKIQMLLGIMSLLIVSPVMAQKKPVVPTTPTVNTTSVLAEKSSFETRVDLLKTNSLSQLVSMGWYTGQIDQLEILDLWNNYTSLSNYLTEKLGRLVVLETDKSDKQITLDAYNGMDLVYTSAIMGSQLVKAGWKPVVGRSEDIQSVVLMKKDVNIKNPKDLKNYNIVAAKGATVSYAAIYSFLDDNIYTAKDILDENTSANFKIESIKQNQLVDLLKNNMVDGIVIRETLANRLMKDSPDKYKIVYKPKVMPGHVVYASPAVSADGIELLRNSFLALNPENPTYNKILSGLDGYQQNDKKPFKVINEKDLTGMDSVFLKIGEKPLFK